MRRPFQIMAFITVCLVAGTVALGEVRAWVLHDPCAAAGGAVVMLRYSAVPLCVLVIPLEKETPARDRGEQEETMQQPLNTTSV